MGDLLPSASSSGNSGGQSSPVDQKEPSYSIFFDQGDHLKELVEAKHFVKAAELYEKYADSFFRSREDRYAEVIDKVSEGIKASFRPQIDTVIARLTSYPPSTNQAVWGQAKSALDQSKELFGSLSKYDLLFSGKRSWDAIAKLNLETGKATAGWKAKAKESFATFDVGKNFFLAYPATVDDPQGLFVSVFEDIKGNVVAGGKDGILSFITLYKDYLTNNAYSKDLANAYVDLSIKNSTGTDRFRNALDAISEASSKGLKVSDWPGMTFAFVETTSKTLLKEGQIQFPVSIEVDLPFKTEKASLESALGADKNKYDFILALEVNLSKNNRRIQKREVEESEFLAGQKTVQNPAYEQARMNVYQAQSALSAHEGSYCNGYGCIAKAIGSIAFGAALGEKRKAFESTPLTLTENVYSTYKYSVSDISSLKTVVATYYIIDIKNKTYFKSEFDIQEDKPFRLAYNVHEKDRNRSSILSRFSSEADLKKFDEQPVVLGLSKVVDQFATKPGDRRSLKDLSALQEEMLKDKNLALASYRKELDRQSATTANDSRFESVVVILNPKGSLGSGFFVEPDLVITNYHVIEGVQFVEMKMHNGLETFGKVVKSDVRLDLALIRTQTRGVPVKFFNGSIPLGSTVEAIGHPRGLEYSITRGIVSAIRKRQSIFGTGGSEVRFVQTDTPINPGNSGGPLFLGNAVIAVNDNKIVKADVEGIGFSIHYTEVEDFLKDKR